MNIELKELQKIIAKNCVTITLKTHRTSPDNQKDPIKLKNLISQAEQRILSKGESEEENNVIKNLRKLEAEINHEYNEEGLVLFANEDIREYARLMIDVQDRVTIGDSFATRDLQRAAQNNKEYYILLLSQEKARLLQAKNDKIIKEIGDEFPMDNDDLHPESKAEKANALRATNLKAEFFNRVDKEVNEVRGKYKLPVLICTEESNFYEYLKVADEKESLFSDYLTNNYYKENNHEIGKGAWKMVQNRLQQKVDDQLSTLKKAVDERRYLSDTNEIWIAAKEGRIKTLFIEEGKYQPAKIENGKVELLETSDSSDENVVDDLLEKIISENSKNGGDVVFTANGTLSEYDGFAAITRY